MTSDTIGPWWEEFNGYRRMYFCLRKQPIEQSVQLLITCKTMTIMQPPQKLLSLHQTKGGFWSDLFNIFT